MKATVSPILSDTRPASFDEAPLAAAPLPWVMDLFANVGSDCDQANGMISAVRHTATASLVTVIVEDAADLAAADFERQTRKAYQLIRKSLADLPAAEPVRFWNHIPFIHQAMDEGRTADRDRYMVFNAGRFKAFCDWFGGSDQFGGRVATASGVGHSDRDLVIHCLAARTRGKAVENPRQIPAFRYSKRYGPLPPCFARATIVRDLLPTGPAVLVGGTASICGERSVHRNQLVGQFRETLDNLASLITAAGVKRDPLAAFSDLRIYYPRKRDARAIEKNARAAFTAAERIQITPADLCRSELLVEIEGVARL
ncbi:hypothetical protein BH10PLA1_BH10PLA1_05100 [soil metagenome]